MASKKEKESPVRGHYEALGRDLNGPATIRDVIEVLEVHGEHQPAAKKKSTAKA